MTIVSGIIVYILTWWVVIFAVLPFGLERDENGTPKNLNMKKKMIITSLISCVVLAGIYMMIEADIISFREMAKLMEME